MNFKKIGITILVVVVLFAVGGVVDHFMGPSFTQYKDVGGEPQYTALIGAERATTEDMEILGITMDKNYAQRVDEYHIFPEPGISGPEVVSKDVLKKGMVFKITKVEECTNCFLDKQIKYSVNIIEPAFVSNQKPIYIGEFSSGPFSNIINGKTVENR